MRTLTAKRSTCGVWRAEVDPPCTVASPMTSVDVPPPNVVAALRAAGCVYAEDEAALLMREAPSAGALATMVGRRIAGEPLEQVLGWAAFCGLRIAVTPSVFIPRRRTELVVRE